MEQKIKVDTEKLSRLNQGFNFLNITETKKDHKYSVIVYMETKQNLNKKEETIQVKSNLPISSYWGRDNKIEDFLETIDNYSKKPFLHFKKTNNRKNVDHWNTNLSNLKKLFRNHTILFSEIDLKIMSLAKEELQKRGINFKEDIKRILNQQQTATRENRKLIERFVFLNEKVLTLETFFESSSYSYKKIKDNTMKIEITKEEYNKQLKEIEKEMKEITGKFGLELKKLEYLVIEQEVDFEKWFEVYKDQLEEDWEYYKNNEDDLASFEEYAQIQYDESEKTIKVDPNDN